MKVFLTGNRGAGKSTTIQRFIHNNQIECTGFVTLPYYDDQKNRIGFCFHSLADLSKNDVPFSIQKEVIPHVFSTFGIEILEASTHGLVILDEIGFLEKDEKEYLEKIEDLLNSDLSILGVLRKCELEHIQKIKGRKDVVVFDLDVIDPEEVYNQLLKMWKEK